MPLSASTSRTAGSTQSFSVPGTVAVGAGTGWFRLPTNMTLVNVAAVAETVPTGADIIVDVNRNGTTVFTTQANRPKVTAGTHIGSAATPDVTALAASDILTVDIDQVGSTVAGANLTVTVFLRESAVAPPATYRDAVLATAGLVSYWRLDETSGTSAADLKGTNVGTYAGGFTLGQPGVTSDGNYATLFNGTSGKVTTASVTVTSAAAMSFEAWVDLTAQASVTPFISSVCGFDAGIAHYAVLRVGEPGQEGKPQFLVSVATTGNGATAQGSVLSTGVWHHLVGTYDGTNVRLYVDGALVDTQPVAGVLTWTAPFHVAGNTQYGDARWLNGRADEVAYYNVTLSGATIASHYAAR